MNQPEDGAGNPTSAARWRPIAIHATPAVFFALGTHDLKGNSVQVQGGSNFGIWWDGDLFREFLNGNQITNGTGKPTEWTGFSRPRDARPTTVPSPPLPLG